MKKRLKDNIMLIILCLVISWSCASISSTIQGESEKIIKPLNEILEYFDKITQKDSRSMVNEPWYSLRIRPDLYTLDHYY